MREAQVNLECGACEKENTIRTDSMKSSAGK